MTKSLDKTTTLHIASNLLSANGQTTTLEVKTSLRSLGFFATQVTVSAFLSELANEDEFDYTDNGIFRVYFNKKSTNTPVASTSTTVVPQTPSINSSAKPAAGDWEVNSTRGGSVMSFSQSLTRDEARRAFIKANPGTKWEETRARKIK